MGVTDWMVSAAPRLAGAAAAWLVKEAGSSGLLLLVVRPLFRGESTAVRFELSAGVKYDEESEYSTQQTWEIPYAAFQSETQRSSSKDGQIPELRIPKELASDVLYRLALYKAPKDKPLWLKLARPYGLLGIALWERELGAVLGRPVLRIPDFPGRPAERPDVLEGALIVDAAPEADPDDVARRTREVAQAVIKGSSRSSTRIHVFAAAHCHSKLIDLQRNERIVVHDPAGALTSIEAIERCKQRGQNRLQSQAWVEWILNQIGARGIDMVHMITRAHWTEAGAYISVSASPSPKETRSALVPVDLDEFGLLLNRVGAWAVTFTPPAPDCRNDLAFIADRLAHHRPGAVMFNAGETSEDLRVLQEACSLLFSARQSVAPILGNSFLHCHPAFVRGEQVPDAGELLRAIADNARLLVERAPFGERLSHGVTKLIPGIRTTELSVPPVWVAALQRYLEEAALAGMRQSGKDALLSNLRPGSPDQKTETLTGSTADTLASIQSVLDSYANQKTGR